MADPVDPSSVRADAEAAFEPSPAAVATTAARALALGSALASPEALLGLDQDLAFIGMPRRPPRWGGWEQRFQILHGSDEVLQQYGLLEEVRSREEAIWVATNDATQDNQAPEWSARVDLWRTVAADARPEDAVAWLRMLMADREPTAAAAASAALARWQRPKDQVVPPALDCAKEALPRYAGADVSAAATIAAAALGLGDSETPYSLRKIGSPPSSKTTSLLVAGTGAWANTWYMTGGDFHTYILDEVRSDIFCGYHAFQWSGAYKNKHRLVAAERLAGWVDDVIGHGLNALFAHSYGGVIALNATTHGLEIKDLVLLSVPAENIRVEWRNIGRTVSLRIHLDIVLLAARRRQYFTENVEENYMPQWFWNHSDSHDSGLWRKGEYPQLLSLT